MALKGSQTWLVSNWPSRQKPPFARKHVLPAKVLGVRGRSRADVLGFRASNIPRNFAGRLRRLNPEV